MGNEFAWDLTCISLYRLENGALTADSQGTNTMTASGSPTANTGDYQEGAGSGSFAAAHPDYLSRADASLSADFPGKSGTTNKLATVCFWAKPSSRAAGYTHVVAKWGDWDPRDWNVGFDNVSSYQWRVKVNFSQGAFSGRPALAGVWYHVAAVIDDANNRLYIRVYDASNGEVYTGTLNEAWGMQMSTRAFTIGGSAGDPYFDGLLDEVVIFGRALSDAEIDDIRDGTYGPPDKATNPSPADGAIEVSTTADCSWTAGANTDTMDVYWGTSPGSLALVSNDQAGTTYDPSALTDYTTYYWRVDCSNDFGTTTGDVWSFRTSAVPAIVPSGRPVRLPKRLVLPDPRNIRTFTPEECRFYNGVEEGIQTLLKVLRDALSSGRNASFDNTELTGNTSIDGSLGIVGDVRVDGKVSFYDGNTYITVDGSGNMTFTDAIVGTHTLKQLGCPTYKRIKATAQAEGDLHLSDATNWNVSKALILCVRVLTVSTNWSLWLLQNDNGYAADDAVIPKLRIARALSGNAALMLNYPYQDEDASGEVHLYYEDTAGADTADLYVQGMEML